MADEFYPFQYTGADWLADRQFGLLADEPGLGKTGQIIRAADLVGATTNLIIPPAGIRKGWEAQIKKWSMFDADINLCTDGQAEPRKNCWNIINYDLLGRGFIKSAKKPSAWLQRWIDFKWDMVSADEAHKLKEQEALRTIAVLGTPTTAGIVHSARRFWPATGTPMPNHPGELFPLMNSMNANPDGETQKSWNYKYCLLKQHGFNEGKPYAAKPQTAEQLNTILKGVMMRRYKSFELPGLPKLRIDDMPVPEVKINLAEFFEDATVSKKSVEDKIRDQEAFVRDAWRRSIASDGEMTTADFVQLLEDMEGGVSLYRRWLGAVKAASMIDDLIDELETGAVKKLVLICYHSQVIEFFKARLHKFGVSVIQGGTTMSARQKIIADFREPTGPRVVLGQIIAMGEGTDGLQHAAHEMIIVEPAWSPYLNAQAACRLHRIGQVRPVRCRMARLADTLDDYISEVLTRKTRDIALIVDG